MPTRLLMAQGHDIHVYYANSNIAPRAEYEKRLLELETYAEANGFAVAEGAYDPESWEREVAPIGEALEWRSPALSARGGDGDKALEGIRSVSDLLDDENRRTRCRACYRMRLRESAQFAAHGGYGGLATTLAVSPYQFTDVIRDELERACGEAGIEPVFEDYRPYYDEATRISRDLGMYRQSYCGCRFSVREGEATRAFVKRQRSAEKAARAAARAAERAEEGRLRKRRAEEKRLYAEKQARKNAVLKAMRESRK